MYAEFYVYTGSNEFSPLLGADRYAYLEDTLCERNWHYIAKATCILNDYAGYRLLRNPHSDKDTYTTPLITS